MPSNGPSKQHRMPNAVSHKMTFLRALWDLGAIDDDNAVTYQEVRQHLGIDNGASFVPCYVTVAQKDGLVFCHNERGIVHTHLTEEGVEVLKVMHRAGRIQLAREPLQRTQLDRTSVVAGADPAFVWPTQSDTVRTVCHGYVAGGAARLPAVERADGLAYRQHPSRRGDTLVYPDGRTEPMPAEGPWPAIRPKLLRAWDLEQVRATDELRKAA